MSEKLGNGHNTLSSRDRAQCQSPKSRPGQTPGVEKAGNVIKIGRSSTTSRDFTAHMSPCPLPTTRTTATVALFWGKMSSRNAALRKCHLSEQLRKCHQGSHRVHTCQMNTVLPTFVYQQYPYEKWEMRMFDLKKK